MIKKEMIISIGIGLRGIEKKIRILDALGFHESEEKRYTNNLIDNFEIFFFNHNDCFFSKEKVIHISVTINGINTEEIDSMINKINEIDLNKEIIEYPNQFGIEIEDPDNRVWQILIMKDNF
ncbi:hypothetical protein [Lampropedia aestuarii]|uniref:hypothetical protein n=1 Tax=Lampropedia aestuarii TaxID=2562762 RepID=UPI0024698A9C|nr:hypothetical protein [Lampropedia aestuarii]MDH5859273.1 hypothetical protein [Lampropedia aestuarii]